MTDEEYICCTCGVGYGLTSGPMPCPICADDRQWLPSDGQRYTTLKELRSSSHNVIVAQEGEEGVWGIGTEPKFAIGQRALLVKTPRGNVLWDCLSLIDDDTVKAINDLGGLHAIAISHPHFIGTAHLWQRAFTTDGKAPPPVYMHTRDRQWVPPSQVPAFTFWNDDSLDVLNSGEGGESEVGVRLLRVGGHFPGSAVALVGPQGDGGRGAPLLLVSDTVFPVPHQQWVSFMYSFPNLLPLPASEVQAIRDTLAPYAFQRLYGPFWHSVIREQAHLCVLRSAERYLAALAGKYHEHTEARTS